MISKDSIVSFEALYRAYLEARKSKRGRTEVRRFELDLEAALCQLSDELRNGNWTPRAYREFTIYDRKARKICAAPFRDRIVHHALIDNLMPVFDARLTSACYACRKGKGVHQAVREFQHASRRNTYVLKLDIQSYFPSIDHRILKKQLQQLFEDQWIRDLFARIIDSAPRVPAPPMWSGADLVDLMSARTGLPIGNLTSQHLGNLYLAVLDDFILSDIRPQLYIRYVDDLLLVDNSKERLWQALGEIRQQLAKLHLTIHPRKIELAPVRQGVDVLGYCVYPHKIRLRRDNGYRYRRRLKRYRKPLQRGDMTLQDIGQSVAAWQGHCQHAQSSSLSKEILNSVVFTLGDAP